MTFTVSAPTLTARGDVLNIVDGFVDEFEVTLQVIKDPPHTLVTVGNCADMTIDEETGFVEMTDVLRYINLICPSDMLPVIKKSMASWSKKPTSVAISTSLMRRDRGVCEFSRKDGSIWEFFFHPALLLSNIEVGASTRTWLISVAAFALSYHHLSKAFNQAPRDFDGLAGHLEARVEVLNSGTGMNKLTAHALATVTPPYPDFNYTTMAHDVVNRLALFARADLAVLQFLQEHDKPPAEPAAEQTSSADITHKQLEFLSRVATLSGDLWFDRSAHAYEHGDRSGSLIVFPSGFLVSIIGRKTTASRIESLIPYLPYEFSGYSGDITRLALIEAQQRKGAISKTATKGDIDAAKLAITTYAQRLATAIILSPVLMRLTKKKLSKADDGETTKTDELSQD